MVCLDQHSITICIHPHTGFAFALGFASDDKEEALERCEGQMRSTELLLLPQPSQSHAHLGNDRTVPNPCFSSTQEAYVRMRILYLFYKPLHTISSRLSNARPQDSAMLLIWINKDRLMNYI